MKKITIKGKEFNVKYSIRSLFIFEQITNKAFEIKTLLDNYIFFYSMILATKNDEVLQWDDFLDEIDNNPELIKTLTSINDEYLKRDEIFNQGEDENGEVKKK